MKSIITKATLIFAIVFGLSSCDKTEDTIAKITVIDIEAQSIPQATVRLFASPSGTTTEVGDVRIDESALTNAAGDAVFDFTEYYEAGQSGLFVLNVEVIKDTLIAESIIKIEPEMINEETVILQ